MTKLIATDIHTHRLDAGPEAIINLEPEMDVPEQGMYSIGIHPWHAERAVDLDALKAKAVNERVVAIGEAGIDALVAKSEGGASLRAQQQAFAWQIALSEELGKPMIIHMVRSADMIVEMRRRLKARQQWIVHGFRGKPQLAAQLLRAGIDISLGERFNADAARFIPTDRLYFETDMSDMPIAQIRARVMAARS